jgi:hypothetical protein
VGSRAGQPSGFADQDETVTLVATVTGQPPPANAVYEWFGLGTITGSGPTAQWHLPAHVSPTPSPVTAELRVTQVSIDGSTAPQVAVTSAPFVMQVHDSQEEILGLGQEFLTLFSRSSVATSEVLKGFSTTCDGGHGKADEQADTDRAHSQYVQDFSKFRITRNTPVTFNFGGRCPFRLRRADACSSFRVHWEVTYIAADEFHYVGEHETTDGTDYVTAVLENNQWRLCHSDFAGVSTNPLTGARTLVSW